MGVQSKDDEGCAPRGLCRPRRGPVPEPYDGDATPDDGHAANAANAANARYAGHASNGSNAPDDDAPYAHGRTFGGPAPRLPKPDADGEQNPIQVRRRSSSQPFPRLPVLQMALSLLPRPAKRGPGHAPSTGQESALADTFKGEGAE